ncbi:hypothetical protein G5V59_03365 [Nocardioides sp. W3-2-3]|uniref:hypothetical protein n=1 Tax=Nocardioides convexus TaxID=2712224 RepID=UPI00241857F8|nr:hypothetical protein [Nocardioides convexus]NGZ99727.1 hypothetical protein [Nocardioides convexus]
MSTSSSTSAARLRGAMGRRRRRPAALGRAGRSRAGPPMNDRRRSLPSADLASAFRRDPGASNQASVPTSGAAPRPSRRRSARSASPSGRLVLWTPVAVRARMQAVQAAHGTLYRDQVLDAIEETVDESRRPGRECHRRRRGGAWTAVRAPARAAPAAGRAARPA